MNEKYKYLTPFKMCVLENFPFIEADFDSLTNYQLLCKVVEYLNKVIDSQNKVQINIEALNNWFKNLDVQEEINNKLDDMAKSGELEEIIASYLNVNSILAYNNLEDLKNATNIVDGSFVKIYGSSSLNDGFGKFYKIRTITSSDNVDNIHIIKLNNSDTLIAEYMNNNTDSFLTPEQFGCTGNGIVDDTINFQKCIDNAIEKNIPIFAFNTYLISSSLKLSKNITIFGNKTNKNVNDITNNFTFIYNGTDYLFDSDSEYDYSLFENISIKGNKNSKAFKNTGYRNKYNNLTIYNFNIGIDFPGEITEWRGENFINGCFFDSNDYAINIDHHLYADSYISLCTFLRGNYSINGSFNSWVLSLSHDYTYQGIKINHFANSEMSNNYFDTSRHFPSIEAQIDFPGGSIISSNKFLTGSSVTETDSSLIKINNNISGFSLNVSNNVASGTRYPNSSFLEFTGNSNVRLSFNGNLMFNIVGKLLKNYPIGGIGSMINYGGYKTISDISGNANFNFCYFNNGIATIMLEVSNAGVTLGILPFKPAISIRIPAYNSSKKSTGSILINASNSQITIPSEWAGDTVLINGSYLVYSDGQF